MDFLSRELKYSLSFHPEMCLVNKKKRFRMERRFPFFFEDEEWVIIETPAINALFVFHQHPNNANGLLKEPEYQL